MPSLGVVPRTGVTGRGFDAPDEMSEMERGVDTTGDPAMREDDRDHEGDWVPYGGGTDPDDPDPDDPEGGGCSASPSGRPAGGFALVGVVIAGIVMRRRRVR